MIFVYKTYGIYHGYKTHLRRCALAMASTGQSLLGKRPLDNAQKPGGMFGDNRLGSALTSNRIERHLWPAGDFNNQNGGPLSAIQHADSKMKGMSQNLASNQTTMTSYINIPRLVVPVIMPSLTGSSDITLKKCLTSGDVVFHLRYNNVMLTGGHATPNTRKFMPDLVYCVNLASLNYILLGIQHVLSRLLFHDEIARNAANNAPNQANNPDGMLVYDQETLYVKYQALKAFSSNTVSFSTTRRWIHFLNMITHGDMEKMMQTALWEGVATAYSQINQEGINENTHIPPHILHDSVSSFLWDFINTYARTAGIFVGSDEQGGNHYGQANPCVQAPTDFVGVIQVAGKNMQVRNLWSSCGSGTSGGDVLGFKLRSWKQITSHSNTAGAQARTTSGTFPLEFEFSPNANTSTPHRLQVTDLISMSEHIDRNEEKYENYTQYTMLMPCRKNDVGVSSLAQCMSSKDTILPDTDTGFLQFGLCEQISKACNTGNMHLKIAINATAATMPMTIQMYMRMGFMWLPSVSSLFPGSKPYVLPHDATKIPGRGWPIQPPNDHAPGNVVEGQGTQPGKVVRTQHGPNNGNTPNGSGNGLGGGMPGAVDHNTSFSQLGPQHTTLPDTQANPVDHAAILSELETLGTATQSVHGGKADMDDRSETETNRAKASKSKTARKPRASTLGHMAIPDWATKTDIDNVGGDVADDSLA